MRIMALDYGSKTVGVALTDELGLTVYPLETISRNAENKLRRTLARIADLVGEYQVTLIVLGRPMHMDGSDGERVAMCEAFKALLEKRVDIEITWQDERLSTYEADEQLEVMQIKKEDRKKYIDQVAACIILKDYLSSKK